MTSYGPKDVSMTDKVIDTTFTSQSPEINVNGTNHQKKKTL